METITKKLNDMKKTDKITDKMLRDAFKEFYGKRAYNASIYRSPRNGGGTIHLIIAGGLSLELYS